MASDKVLINLATGLEDAERRKVAFLSARASMVAPGETEVPWRELLHSKRVPHHLRRQGCRTRRAPIPQKGPHRIRPMALPRAEQRGSQRRVGARGRRWYRRRPDRAA